MLPHTGVSRSALFTLGTCSDLPGNGFLLVYKSSLFVLEVKVESLVQPCPVQLHGKGLRSGQEHMSIGGAHQRWGQWNNIGHYIEQMMQVQKPASQLAAMGINEIALVRLFRRKNVKWI